ncbi:MAG: metallophosphoesterase [Actinomycetota bacterium]|nr:metallophosphoesterase [Actinomycetota bacterium]
MRRPTLLAAGAVALAALEPFVEPHLPVLRRASVPVLPPGRTPLRVLHLSDLHLSPGSWRRAGWVRRLARLEPHLVVSTGDHLSSYAALPLLTGIAAAFDCPGAFVPGNNDYFTPIVPRPWTYVRGGPPLRRRQDLPWRDVAAALTAAGWTDLTHRRVRLPALDLTLTGTDDGHLGRDRYRRVQGRVAGLALGVTHTPQRRLLEAFGRDGHALVLAGHTHGGQVRLPGLGPLVTNCDLPRPRARGLTRGPSSQGSAWLHVSAGLGTSPYAPVRLCCRPEATLLDLVAGFAEDAVG